MAAYVLKHARAFAVLVARWFIEDARTGITGTGDRSIDVWHAHLDDVGGDASARCDLIATDVGDDDGAVRSDSQLSAVRFADAHPFLEAERRLQPRYRRSYIGVDEHRGYSDGRRGTIRQHDRKV